MRLKPEKLEGHSCTAVIPMKLQVFATAYTMTLKLKNNCFDQHGSLELAANIYKRRRSLVSFLARVRIPLPLHMFNTL